MKGGLVTEVGAVIAPCCWFNPVVARGGFGGEYRTLKFVAPLSAWPSTAPTSFQADVLVVNSAAAYFPNFRQVASRVLESKTRVIVDEGYRQMEKEEWEVRVKS